MSPLHIVRDSLTVLVGGLLLVLSGVAVAGATMCQTRVFWPRTALLKGTNRYRVRSPVARS